MLDAVGDRLILRIRGDKPWTTRESWYPFALAEGSQGPVIDPESVLLPDPRLGWVEETCVVPESGLVLARWQVFDQRRHGRGALFALYERGAISYEDAMRNADSKNELRLRIKLESKREDRLQAEASSTLRIVDESNDGKVY